MVAAEEMDQALHMVQGGRRSWKHTVFNSLLLCQCGTPKTRGKDEQAREDEEDGMEIMEDGLWILNTEQSGTEERPAPPIWGWKASADPPQ